MKLESPVTTVSGSREMVYTALTEVRNFEKLMPDNVAEFEILDKEKFLFALKGMPRITLQLREKQPPEKIIYESADGKVQFTLTIHVHETAPEESEVQFIFQGEFNAMMGMMIKNPIKNFIGVLSENTAKLT